MGKQTGNGGDSKTSDKDTNAQWTGQENQGRGVLGSELGNGEWGFAFGEWGIGGGDVAWDML
jgi:hypothetical protein